MTDMPNSMTSSDLAADRAVVKAWLDRVPLRVEADEQRERELTEQIKTMMRVLVFTNRRPRRP